MVKKSHLKQAHDEAFRLAEQQVQTFIAILTKIQQRLTISSTIVPNQTYQNTRRLEDILNKAVCFYNNQYHSPADRYQYLPSLKQQTLASYQSLAKTLQAMAADPEQATEIFKQFSQQADDIVRMRQRQLIKKHIVLCLAFLSLISTWITSSVFFTITQLTTSESRLYRANDLLIFTAASSAALFSSFSLFKQDLNTGTQSKELRQAGFTMDKLTDAVHAVFACESEGNVLPYKRYFTTTEFEQASSPAEDETQNERTVAFY